MSIRRAFSYGIMLALMLSACTENQDEAGAKELLAEVSSGYNAWSSPLAFKDLVPSETLHKSKVRVFFNDVMEPLHRDLEDCCLGYDQGENGGDPPIQGRNFTLSSNITEWPVGSVLVKEGFSDSDLEIIAVMEKQDEGWFYAEYTASGEVLFSGRDPETCVSCHVGAMHDYTFTAHFSYRCPSPEELARMPLCKTLRSQ